MSSRTVDPSTGDALKASLIGAWSVLAAGIIGFSTIAFIVTRGLGDELDRRVLLLFHGSDGVARGPDWLIESISDITALGGYPVIMLVVLLAVCALLATRHATAAGYLVLAIASGSMASTALKLLFSRNRPDFVEHLDRTFTSSFPSAHAMLSMLAWLTLGAVLVRFVTSRRLSIMIIAAAVLLSLLIGSSRVFLGVHWPSDVLAGWLAGIAWASACWLLAHYLSRRPDRVGRFGRSS